MTDINKSLIITVIGIGIFVSGFVDTIISPDVHRHDEPFQANRPHRPAHPYPEDEQILPPHILVHVRKCVFFLRRRFIYSLELKKSCMRWNVCRHAGWLCKASKRQRKQHRSSTLTCNPHPFSFFC